MGLKESGLRGSLRNVSVGIDAIPDGVVDNFEDADSDPAGPYEEGETLDTYYTDVDGSFNRTTTDVIEGDKAVEGNGTADGLISEPGDGLPRYPEEGDKIEYLIRTPGNVPRYFFNMAFDGTNLSGYELGFNLEFDDAINIRRIDDGTATELASSSISASQNTWYLLEIDPPTTNSSSIDCTVYNVDTEDLSRGSQVADVSASDDNYIDQHGVGVRLGASETGTILDRIRVL